MADSSKLLSQPKPLSRWVVGPLFVTSIALHGLLLVAPLPSGPSATPEEEAAEADSAEDQIVDILSIASPNTPAPEEAPPPSQPPPAAVPPAPAPQAPAPVNPDRLPPPSETAPVETVAPTDDFSDPVEPPAQESSEAAAFDFSGARNDFMVNLGSGIGLTNYTSALGLPARNNFRDPAIADTFLSNPDSVTPGPPPGARDAQWLDKEPDSVLTQLVGTYSAAGVNFSELAPYAGERFFVALTPDNQPFLYLSMVRLQGSTLLVIWDNPPAGAAI